MKKLLLIAALTGVISAAACKKEHKCWFCENTQGDYYKTVCSPSEVNTLKGQGYTCTEE